MEYCRRCSHGRSGDEASGENFVGWQIDRGGVGLEWHRIVSSFKVISMAGSEIVGKKGESRHALQECVSNCPAIDFLR